MRLTIVPHDRCIIKDGAVLLLDFTAPAGVHAIQWYGEHGTGTIEYNEAPQEHFTDFTIVQPFADAYDAEAARLEALMPAPPTAAELRRPEIISRLSAIDAASARPFRDVTAALAAGQPAPAFAVAKLAALETEAAALRAELAALPA